MGTHSNIILRKRIETNSSIKFFVILSAGLRGSHKREKDESTLTRHLESMFSASISRTLKGRLVGNKLFRITNFKISYTTMYIR